MPEGKIAVAEAVNKGEAYLTSITTGIHTVFADEPYAIGGLDKAPSPSDYLVMSLASCKAITLRMYAKRKEWPLEDVIVNVKLVKDVVNQAGSHTFFCEIQLDGNLTIQQKERLLEISKACPIQRLLSKGNEVATVLI